MGFSTFGLWRKPLALLYIGAVLGRAGVEVAFESVLEDIGRERTDEGLSPRRPKSFNCMEMGRHLSDMSSSLIGDRAGGASYGGE